MVKKSLMVGGGILLLLGLLFGADTLSYLRTGVRGAQSAVRDAVPLEFQLNRARDMIRDLDPEIKRNLEQIAREEVAVDDLRKLHESKNAALTKSRGDIERLTNDLKRGDSNYVYCGKSYTQGQVESDLRNRFEQHKVKENTLGKLAENISAREKALAAGRERLKEMMSAKEQLVVDVENIEARLEMVKVAQTTNHFEFDNSTLARTRDLIKDIDSRVSVAEKLVHATPEPAGQINLDEEKTGNITDEVTKYFGEKSDASVAVQLD